MVNITTQLEQVEKSLRNLESSGLVVEERSKATLEALLRERDERRIETPAELIDIKHRVVRLLELVRTGGDSNPTLVEELDQNQEPRWIERPYLNIPDEQARAIALQMFKSSRTKPGDKAVIVVSPESRKIAEEVIVLCMENEVDFEIDFRDYRRQAILAKHLPNETDVSPLRVLAATRMNIYEGVGTMIRIDSVPDPRAKELGNAGKSEALTQMMTPLTQRLRSGDLHYILTLIPTPSDAQLDGMDYEEYLRLFTEACDQPWEQIQEAQEKLKEHFDAAHFIRIRNDDGTDVTLDVRDMTFANSVVLKNLPGSELFSAPRREGVNGTIVAKGRFQYRDSGIMENITLHFKDGRIVDFDAEVGKEDLAHIIQIDDDSGEGSRFTGEIGIGTNPHLRKHLINGLLVEKIGGSFHVALGSCYSYEKYDGHPVKLKNGNQSAAGVHWDLTTLLRDKSGSIELDYGDGRGFQSVQWNGEWLLEGVDVLNKGWGALPEGRQPQWWKERYPEGYSK